jgi:hypothetical protein
MNFCICGGIPPPPGPPGPPGPCANAGTAASDSSKLPMMNFPLTTILSFS